MIDVGELLQDMRRGFWRFYYLRVDAGMYLFGRWAIDAWRRAAPTGSCRHHIVGILKNSPALLVCAWLALLEGFCRLMRIPSTLKAKVIITCAILVAVEVAAVWWAVMGGR